MNSLKSTAAGLVALISLIGFGCKKSDDTSRNPGTVSAVFTLGGAGGTCTGATTAGSYTVGTALTSSNTVSIQVNVTTAGTYSITTSTANGISFSGSGSFASTGAQTVALKGTGTPVAAGSNNHTVTAGGGSCSFSVTAVGGSGSAAFTLAGAGGTCTGAASAGTYTVGTALTASNTVSIQVNVTSIGAYSISSTLANGISFSGSGTFTSTGTKTVALTGTGTPVAATATNYTVTAGGGSCTFSITPTGGSAKVNVQFTSADDLTDWEISGDKPKGPQVVGKKEGAAYLEADLVDGVDYLHFIYRRPTKLNAGVTEENGQLRFWFYVTDVSQMRLSGPGVDPGQIEITSSGISDFNEYSWNTDSVIATLHNGWNEVKLEFSKSYKTPTAPDPNGLNLFRIYFWSNSAVHPTVKFGIDDVRIQEK